MSTPTYNGTPIPILTLPPDWEKSFPSLRVLESTLINEALDQSEERWQRYPRPLYGLNFTSKAIDSQQQGYFRKFFETAEALPVGVPLWTEAAQITAEAAAGATTLFTSDTSGTLFAIADYLLIWADWQTWEVVKCNPVVMGGFVSLSETTAKAWHVGATIMPILFGYCARPPFSALDAADSGLEIQFEERFLLGRFSREIPITPGTPTLSYSSCNTTVAVDFGSTISGLKRWHVETSTDGTTWHHYTYAKRSRSRLVFNNYFDGARYVRISIIWLDLSVSVGIYTFRPTAAQLQPPTISITGLNSPLFPLPSNYIGASGVDGSNVLVTADQEQLDLNGNALLKIPCGEAFIEATKQDYRMDSWTGPQSPSTMAVNLSSSDAGTTVRFTIDGTDPSGPTSGLASGTVISPYLVSFGLVLIARAFKDGCASPPTYLLVDKAIEMQDRFESKVAATATSHACDLFNWQRIPDPGQPDDCIPTSIHRSCFSEFGSNNPGDILGAWGSGLTYADSGPSLHLCIISYDLSDLVSGATTDPGTCSLGSTWTDGTLGLVATIQQIVSLQTSSQSVLASDLSAFPNCLTCVLAEPGDVQDRTMSDFFGPSRDVTGWTDSEVFLYAGGSAVGALKTGHPIPNPLTSATFNAVISSIKLVATLAPTDAPDIWNPDDLPS